MPGETRINLRASQEVADRLKEAAQKTKMSLTTFLLTTSMHVADKLLDGETELVVTTVRQAPVQVQAEPEPREIPYGPDMPLGMASEEQLERFLAGVKADRIEEEERRLERELFNSSY